MTSVRDIYTKIQVFILESHFKIKKIFFKSVLKVLLRIIFVGVISGVLGSLIVDFL